MHIQFVLQFLISFYKIQLLSVDPDTDEPIHHVTLKFKAPYYIIISVEGKRHQWPGFLATYGNKEFIHFSGFTKWECSVHQTGHYIWEEPNFSSCTCK